MTLDQVRDRIAELLGEKFDPAFNAWYNFSRTPGQRAYRADHPCPTTLDGIAALMPDGWFLCLRQYGDGSWSAEAATGFSGFIRVRNGAGLTELEARTRLLLAVREAAKEPA